MGNCVEPARSKFAISIDMTPTDRTFVCSGSNHIRYGISLDPTRGWNGFVQVKNGLLTLLLWHSTLRSISELDQIPEYRFLCIESTTHTGHGFVRNITVANWIKGFFVVTWQANKIEPTPGQVSFKVTFSIGTLASRALQTTPDQVSDLEKQCKDIGSVAKFIRTLEQTSNSTDGLQNLSNGLMGLTLENKLNRQVEDQKKNLKILLDSQGYHQQIHFRFPDDPLANGLPDLEANIHILGQCESLVDAIKKQKNIEANQLNSVINSSTPTVIKIEGFKRATFRSMIYFLYTGELDWGMNGLKINLGNEVKWEELFLLADCFDLQDLRAICRHWVLKSLSVTTAMDLLFGFGICFQDIKEPTMEFILNHSQEIFESDGKKDPMGPFISRVECQPIIKELMRRLANKSRRG